MAEHVFKVPSTKVDEHFLFADFDPDRHVVAVWDEFEFPGRTAALKVN